MLSHCNPPLCFCYIWWTFASDNTFVTDVLSNTKNYDHLWVIDAISWFDGYLCQLSMFMSSRCSTLLSVDWLFGGNDVVPWGRASVPRLSSSRGHLQITYFVLRMLPFCVSFLNARMALIRLLFLLNGRKFWKNALERLGQAVVTLSSVFPSAHLIIVRLR